MRHQIVSFFLLIIFRVFLVPVWFAWHTGEIKDTAGTFEHIRLKKRRSSYLEENSPFVGICLSQAILSTRVQRLIPFCPGLPEAGMLSQEENMLLHLTCREKCLPLYLRNKVLRI